MKKLICVLFLVLILTGCGVVKEEQPMATGTIVPFRTAVPTIVPSRTAVPTETETPAMAPTPTALPTIELVAEAECPAPEEGDWYESDIAGNYPGNGGSADGILYYDTQGDLLIRIIRDGSPEKLVVSHLDGSAATVVDECANTAGDCFGSVSLYGGRIYYIKDDGVWIVNTDGTELQMITHYTKEEYITCDMFVYDGRIYLMTSGDNDIISCDLEGRDERVLSVHDIPLGDYIFEDGCLYYDAISEEDEGGDCWSIYRCDLQTGKSRELTRCAMGSMVVQDGWAYYMDDVLCRTDGNKTVRLGNFDQNDYTMYRNYLLSVSEDNKLIAYDTRSKDERELFNLTDYYTFIYVSEDSVFLYSGYAGDPIFRITFEDDMARLWKLNGVSQTVF